MKKFIAAIGLVTLVASPVFAMPVDAVTFAATLIGATIAVANTRPEQPALNSSRPAQQPSPLRAAGVAAGVQRRPQARPRLLSAWRRMTPGTTARPAQRAVGA